MRLLSLFSGYNTLKDCASSQDIDCISLDIKNYRCCTKQDLLMDFIDFDFHVYDHDYFDFIVVGFPCYTTSKASGGFHFLDNAIPLTSSALKTIEMLERLKSLLDYFSTAIFLIENPVSAIFSNYHFERIFGVGKFNHFRLYQSEYGHKAFKHSEFCTNSDLLFLHNPVHRRKGISKSAKFDNLSLKQRQSYPGALCQALIEYLVKSRENRNTQTGKNSLSQVQFKTMVL